MSTGRDKTLGFEFGCLLKQDLELLLALLFNIDSGGLSVLLGLGRGKKKKWLLTLACCFSNCTFSVFFMPSRSELSTSFSAETLSRLMSERYSG